MESAVHLNHFQYKPKRQESMKRKPRNYLVKYYRLAGDAGFGIVI